MASPSPYCLMIHEFKVFGRRFFDNFEIFLDKLFFKTYFVLQNNTNNNKNPAVKKSVRRSYFGYVSLSVAQHYPNINYLMSRYLNLSKQFVNTWRG